MYVVIWFRWIFPWRKMSGQDSVDWGQHSVHTTFINVCFVFIGKPGTDPNSAAWAAYYAHYYQQQAQPPPAAPPGGPATTQTNGQGSCSVKLINFLLLGVSMPNYFLLLSSYIWLFYCRVAGFLRKLLLTAFNICFS